MEKEYLNPDTYKRAFYSQFIGRKAKKNSNRPFKSSFKMNTIKGVIMHPVLDKPCYTFFEDESYVECGRCTPQLMYKCSVQGGFCPYESEDRRCSISGNCKNKIEV